MKAVAPKQDLIRRVEARFAALEAEYRGNGWEEHQRECSEYVMPRTGRFLTSDGNRARRRNESLIDNTATRSARVCAAGLMSGLSSPHQQWMRLLTDDPDLNAWHPVRTWLGDLTTRMLRVFRRSNFYRAVHQMYEELVVYGTACMIVDQHDTDVIHCHVLTAGQYYLAASRTGKINTVYRKLQMTVAQLVDEFGLEKCSREVQQMYADGHLDKWRDVIHAIEPRSDRDPRLSDTLNMPWRSVYFEKGNSETINDVLRESGYEIFPVLAPRWHVTPGDVYGNGPGMESLGDNIQLQDQQLRFGQAVAYKVKPATILPTDLKNDELDLDPGGENFSDATSPGGQQARAAWQVDLDIGDLIEAIQQTTRRVSASFFADLFMMLYETGGHQRTAEEVRTMHAEKMLMLGPTLERLDTELLSPAIDITYAYMMAMNLVPEPPEELDGRSVTPEFVSVLAQAQRAAGINSIRAFMLEVSQVATWNPDVRDRVDVDEWANDVAERYGVPPKMMRDDPVVAEIRQQRAAAQAAQAQLAAQQQAATIAKDVASAQAMAPVDPMGMFSGLGAPTA